MTTNLALPETITIDTRRARELANTDARSGWLYQLLTIGLRSATAAEYDLHLFIDTLAASGYRIERSRTDSGGGRTFRVVDANPMPLALSKALTLRPGNRGTASYYAICWKTAKWAKAASPEAVTAAVALLVECYNLPVAQVLATAEVVAA